MPRQNLTLFERFWINVDKTDTCWNWIGAACPQGYGKIMAMGKPDMRANRVSWYLAHGEFPSTDMFVCHKCDNPRCVRPSHLFLGSAVENTWDAHRKGRLKRPSFVGSGSPTAILNEDKVRDIYIRRRSGERGRVLAREYGVSEATVALIKMGKLWRHITGPLESC